MRFLDRESLRVVLLDAKQHLIKVVTVSQGTLNEALAHPREILKPVITHSA
jgi:DNA repair protein RadC